MVMHAAAPLPFRLAGDRPRVAARLFQSIAVFDLETFLIRHGVQAPELVCATWLDPITREEGIVHWSDALEVLRAVWSAPLVVGHNIAFDAVATCQAFPELAPLVFKAYRERRVRCTQIREQLLDIRDGKFEGYENDRGEFIKPTYSLASLVAKYLGRDISASKAEDAWRLKYGTLWHLPIDQWPREAVEYPLDDVRHTASVFYLQEERSRRPNFAGVVGPIVHEQDRTAVDFALKLMSTWGLRTSPATVARLKKKTDEGLERLAAQLSECVTVLPTSAREGATLVYGPAGAVVKVRNGVWEKIDDSIAGVEMVGRPAFVRPDGSRDTKAVEAFIINSENLRRDAAMRAGEEFTPLARWTKGGTKPNKKTGLVAPPKVSLSAGALADLSEEHPILELYGEFGELRSVLAKDVAALSLGTWLPIHSRFGMAVSDRVTSAKPNVQNWRVYPGIRECFVPRAGHVFMQADFSGLELATLGEVCRSLFGHSALADAIRAGKDPHLMLAANFLGITYEEADLRYQTRKKTGDVEIELARKRAKPTNFGLPGGLGLAKFILFSKLQYHVDLDEKEAARLRDLWFKTWPEMRQFFAYVRSLRKRESVRGRDYWVTEIVTKRVRGGCLYPAACNDLFQSLGAAVTLRALLEITFECYDDPTSPLYGCRVVNCVHDEFILEAPEGRAHAAAMRMQAIAEAVARTYLPYAPPKAEPLLMRRWSKAAHELRDPVSNDLVPWDVDQCGCKSCIAVRKDLDLVEASGYPFAA